jgi:hypothetical protein
MRKTYKRYPTQKGDWDYITPDKARQLGYIVYAGPYKPVAEQWMVDNAVADIIKNGRDKYAVVPVGASIEIHILPNYYGIPNHTSAFKLQTFHEIERDEKAELAKETLAQVEAAEEKI